MATQSTEALPLVDKIVKAHIIAGFTFFFASIFAGSALRSPAEPPLPLPRRRAALPRAHAHVAHERHRLWLLFNNFIAALLWIVPRLTGKPVLSKKLSWFVFWAWQVIVGATAVGLIGGQAQAIEWGETPVWIDPVVVIGAPR
jgi:cytochrome c oxidase cbb3-type subunit 1